MKPVSVYRVAIDQTTKAIDTRAKYFRNLIVAVTMLCLSSLGWAIAARTLSPLSGLLLLFPLCSFFFLLDGSILDHWRSRLVEIWIQKNMDFKIFCDVISAVQGLPKNTLASMLATLPSSRTLVAEQEISASTREAVAAVITKVHEVQSDTLALKTAAATILSVSVAAAVYRRTWEPLSSSFAILLLPILGKSLRRKRKRTFEKKGLAARAKPGFSEEMYQELVARLCSPSNPIQ